MNLAYIPSPSEGVWHLGPLPLRAYALAIIVGIVVAIWVGERRFVHRGGRSGTVSDVAVWAIPFGLVGARIYHVATNPEFYFGDGKEPIQALYVWEGGLGIWGAIGFGALGAYLGCRYSGVKFTSYVDAVAPGIVLAQAIGRWGNYFNQELFGKPTDKPWALEIDLENRPEGYLEFKTFHPTFLYESLWCIGVAIVLLLVDRKFRLGRGRVFALYVALYTAGRAWIEDLRIDDAHEFGPFRLNVWVAIGIFVLAVAYFVIVGRRWPGREKSVRRGVSDDEADREEAEESEDAKAAGEMDEDKDDEESEAAGDGEKSATAAATAGSDDDAEPASTDAEKPDADAPKADADEGSATDAATTAGGSADSSTDAAAGAKDEPPAADNPEPPTADNPEPPTAKDTEPAAADDPEPAAAKDTAAAPENDAADDEPAKAEDGTAADKS